MASLSRPTLWLRELVLGLVVLVVRSLPPEVALRVFRGLGAAWWWGSPRRRHIAAENLRVAGIPSASRVSRAAFAQLGQVAAEVIWADRLFARGGAARRRFRFVGAWDEVFALREAGQAGLFLTGHLGNWEAAAWAVRAQGLPMRSVVRTLDDPVLDRFVTGRRGGGGGVIRKWGATREALRAIRDGTWVAFLGDQNAGRHGTYVPFFGLAASTFPFPGVLATRRDIPVFVGYALGLGHSRYEVHVERLPQGLESAELALEAFHGRLEAWIRAHPEQYNWTHRRWRSRPIAESGNPILPVYSTRAGIPIAADVEAS